MPIFGRQLIPRMKDKKLDSVRAFLKNSKLFNVTNTNKWVLDQNYSSERVAFSPNSNQLRYQEGY